MNIKNKVAIVTGGTGGIGFATVQLLLKNGVKQVGILDVDSTKNRSVDCLTKIEKEYGKNRATFHVCDVTNKNNFEAVYDQIAKTYGGVDILINNAGILSDVQGDLMIDINLKSVVNCTLIAIDRMGKHNHGKCGTVLNVASSVGLVTSPAFPIYTATKHGVYAFTRSLKENYEYTGVRTLVMCPEVTQTNFLQRNWREESLKFVPDKFLDELLHCSDVIQSSENVAEAIVQMLSDAATGSTWVSGGNRAPYAIKDLPHYEERKIQV